MSVDTELDTWRREWQAEREVVPDLAAKVRRHSRFMRAMLAADVLVTLVMGGGITAWAVRSSETDVMVLAAATWFFLAIAWTFATINRKGCWAPAALNASAFLDISIRRCRRGIAASQFGVILYCCEIVFCLMWIYQRKHGLTFLSMAFVGMITAAFAAFLIWYQRRKQAELACLRGIRRKAHDILTPDSQA